MKKYLLTQLMLLQIIRLHKVVLACGNLKFTICACLNRKPILVHIRHMLCTLVILLSVNFQIFSQTDFQLNGKASVISTDCYELTPDQGTVFGSIWYKQKIDLTEDFTLNSNMYFGTKDATGADGIVFAFQGVCTNAGSTGDGLGFAGISPSIFIEFDTWQNGGAINDPTYDHISIFRDGVNYHGSTQNLSATVQASSTSANIEDGAYHNVKINWFAATKKLEVYFDGSLRTSYTGDIINTIFGGNQFVYYGFTAATGGSSNVQRVCLINPPMQNEAVICNGSSTQLSIIGAGVGTYTWSPAATLDKSTGTTVTANPTTTTTYTVTGTGGACGNVTFNITVTVVPIPTPVLSSTSAVCEGSTKTYTTPLHAGSTYAWTVTGAASYTVASNTVTVVAGATNYSISVVETEGVKGCSNTAGSGVSSATITVIPKPVITTTGGVYCIGAAGKTITATGAGAGGTYSWSPATGLSVTNIANPVASPTVTTTYTVTGTNSSGCSNTATASVSAYNRPTVTATGGAFCSGGSGVTLASTGAGTAGTYSWSPATNLSSTSVANPLAKPTATTTYTVTATDINSCSSTATATVTVNPLPTITASGGAYCAGGAGLSLNASGAGVGGSYTWSPATNLSAITVANPIASPTNTSTYTVTGTNTNGCSSTATATVTVNPLPTVTATASLPVLCVGKNTTLTGSGASTYTWNNGVVNGVSFAPTSTKTYTVTGTAANGCTNTASVTITVNPLPNIAISASDNTVCIGANTILTATGASTYVWNNGVVNGVAFAPVTTKSYTVTGTDLNGCINSATATVTVNPLPIVTANASPNVVCIGKTTILNASGASTYTWDNGVTNGVAFAPATTKTYTVTGTDINGCKNTVSTVVTVNPLPTILPTATSSVICTGQSTVLSATGAAVYTWNNGVVNGVSFTPTSTKTYTVTGVDANSCQNTANIVITVNAKPTVTASSTSSAVCIGKPITLNGGGALTYTWNNGAVNAVAFNPTLTKTYTVTGTDANGCTNTAEVTITVHALPNVVANASKTSICLGETVVLNGTGALTFAWDNGVTNGIAFAPSTTKSYTVLGTDGNGCQNTATVNMVVNPLPSAPQTRDLNLCKNDPNPDLSAHVTGTNLRWYDDEQAGSFISNPTVNTVNSGINSLFVSQTDGNSCESPRARITIKVNDYPIAKIIASDLGYCKGLENGVLLRAQNEGAEVLYEWFHDGISKTGGLPIDYYDHALAGVWTVGVRNTTTGCTTISSAVTVIEEIPPVAAISTQGPGLEYCKNNPNGTLLIASDAGPNTTYEWFKNGVSQSTASSFNKNYNNAFAGTWSLKVVNTVSTCPSTSASVVVMEKSVPVSSIANTGSNDAYCFGENGITLNAQVIPGAAYEWFKNGISVGSGITKNNALFGTWLLRVTVDGCTDTSNAFIVKEKPLHAAAITLSANSYCADKSGVTITAADAGTGATYEWFLNNVSQGTPNSNPIHFNSIAGDWKVKTLFGGCANTSLVKTVKIDTLPNAQILTSGSALQYCQYTNGVTLMAKDQGAGSIYNWYKDGVLISSTNVNTYSNATKGNWSMMVSNICGAVTQSVSPVTEKLLPNASIAVSASEYCAGTTGVLLTGKAVSGATYQWFKNGLSLGAATFNNTLINALAGNYSVVVSLNGCDSTSAQVQISENSLPTATISGNQSICNKSGELATLDLMLTGQAPWKITYQRPDGKQVSFNATSADQHISESLSGEYKVLKVSDLKCNGITSGLASVQYFSSPKISNVTRVCLPSATAFVVQFDIQDGDVNSYNVSGYAGKLLGNTWTSDSIPENLTITLAINDKNNCNPLIETFSKSCSCLAEATMTGGGAICNDGVSQSMILVALEGKSPWKIEYTIDNGAAVQLDGIIASPYQINTGKNGTYKLTKVFDGNCKGAVNGSATVAYYDFPTAMISGESTICTGNESANLMINFTGQSPWKVNILTPNGPQLMSGITTNPLSYQPSAIGDYSLISVNDHHCEGRNTDISGLGRVNAYAKPDSSNLKVLCDSSDQYYIVMDIINGDGQSYQIDGAQGTMVGNQWTSQMIPSGQFTKLTLTDNNTCSPLVISGINKTCLCPASGTITGNRVFCDDSAKASVHIALTGTAPWEITYRLNGGTVVKSTSLTNEFVIHQVSKTSDFNLIQVSDAKCTNSANSQALVIVNELPTAIINGGGEVCENSPSHMLVINFTGTPPYKFSYTDGLIIHDTVSNSGIYQMIKPKDGEYKVLSVTDANGCVATRMEGESKVNVRKFTGASIIGSTGICYGDNTAVTINFDSLTNAPFKLTYDGGDGFEIIDQINTNPYQIQINPKNSSVVKIIELVDLHQCANTNFADSVLIDVTPIPRLKVINNVSSICSGSKTAINFVSVVTGTENSTKFTWTAKQNKNIAGITMTGVSDSISDLLTNLSDKLESVTYTVIPATYTITNKACYGQGKDVQVTVRKPTFPVLGADQSEVCPGTTLFLQPGNFSGGTYSWYINDSLLPNTLEEYSFIVPFGKSSVRSSYKDVCGNIHSDTLWINSKSKVTVDFTKVDTCLGMMTKFTPVQIAGNAVVDSWTWQFVNAGMLTKSDMNRPESSVSFAKPGKQKVILEAFNAGCKLGDTIGYVNIENCDFEIVNTFTPNADGKNDLWEIKGIERFPNAHIVIVNRWGMVVHEIPGPIKAWDGTNDKGELLESGVYYYIITLNKVADSNETIQGHINLIVSSDGR